MLVLLSTFAREEPVRPVVRPDVRQGRPGRHPAHRPLPHLREEPAGQAAERAERRRGEQREQHRQQVHQRGRNRERCIREHQRGSVSSAASIAPLMLPRPRPHRVSGVEWPARPRVSPAAAARWPPARGRPAAGRGDQRQPGQQDQHVTQRHVAEHGGQAAVRPGQYGDQRAGHAEDRAEQAQCRAHGTPNS